MTERERQLSERPHTDSELGLSDGRVLAYCEWGDPAGDPVIYCHGLPGSRLECWGGSDAYARVAVRLITLDRPGIGRSEPKPERSMIDWPSDVAELAEALRLERFAVAGHSAGGAYALACAERLRDAVSEVAVFAPVPRVDRPGGLGELATARYWELARRRPGVLRAVYRLLGGGLRTVPRLAARMFLHESAQADRVALSAAEPLRRFRASVLEGMRSGPRGVVEDMRVLLQPWGLDESRIGARVHLWHGEADAHVAPSSTSRYAQRIPAAKVTLVEDEGHFSLIERRAAELFRELRERQSR